MSLERPVIIGSALVANQITKGKHLTVTKQGPLSRYLSILEMVAASHRSLSLTDIATLAELPKPTVYRLTKSLVEVGALTADDTHQKGFQIGPRMWRLLHLGLDRSAVSSIAQLVCDDLANDLRETCYVVRLGREHVRAIARSAPDQGHRLHVFPGAELPPHAASSAKAILAFQPETVALDILGTDLPALTERTKTTVDEVKSEWKLVRENGYAICDREIDDNIMAYAYPVRLASAGVLYSIGVTGPCSRLNQRDSSVWIEHIRAASQRFSTMLETLST